MSKDDEAQYRSILDLALAETAADAKLSELTQALNRVAEGALARAALMAGQDEEVRRTTRYFYPVD